MTEYSRKELYRSIAHGDDIFVSEKFRELVNINYEIFARAEDDAVNKMRFNEILQFIDDYKKEYSNREANLLDSNYFEFKNSKNALLEDIIRKDLDGRDFDLNGLRYETKSKYYLNRITKNVADYNNEYIKKYFITDDVGFFLWEEIAAMVELVEYSKTADFYENMSIIKAGQLEQWFLSYAYDDKLYTLCLFIKFLKEGKFLYIDWMHNKKIDNANMKEALNLKEVLKAEMEKSAGIIYLRSPNSELKIRGNHYIRPWCSWELGNFFYKEAEEHNKYYISLYDENEEPVDMMMAGMKRY